MNTQELTISIQSKFDGKGTTDAKKHLEATAKSADKVGASSKKAGKDMKSGLQNGAGATDLLTKRISKLNLILTGFGIVGIIGAITTVINLIKRLTSWIGDKLTEKIRAAAEASRKLADQLSDHKMKLAQQMVDNVATSYDNAATSINNATTAQRQYLTALEELNTAQQEATALELDRRELAALAAAEGDEVQEAAVKARYAKMRLADSLGRRGAKAIRGEQSARDELDAAAARRAAATENLSKARQTRENLAQQLGYAKEKADFIPAANRSDKQVELDKEQRKKAQEEVEKFTTQLATLDSTIVKLTDILAAQTAAERAADIRLQAARVRSGPVLDAAAALTKQQASDIDRGLKRPPPPAEPAPIKEDTRYQDAQQKTEDAYQAFKDARGAQDPSRVIMEFLREYRAARSEQNKLFRQLQAEAKAQKQEIINLQQNQRRAGSGG